MLCAASKGAARTWRWTSAELHTEPGCAVNDYWRNDAVPLAAAAEVPGLKHVYQVLPHPRPQPPESQCVPDPLQP
jgi:hypothetical protein